MRLVTPPPEVAALGLRAMKTVIAAGPAGLSPAARGLLGAAQRNVLHTSLDLEALTPITPEELASGVGDPGFREQLVMGLLTASLTDGKPSAAQGEAVERYAEALGVENGAVKDLKLLADRHLLLFRLDFLRRGHLRDMLHNQLEDHGLLGVVKAVLGLRGMLEDAELAARYRALEQLPDRTFGREYARYIRTNGFSFPGEKGGFPEAGIYHDFSHVLGGYHTDPEGELQVSAFIAGFKKVNPYLVVMFTLLTFSAGVNVTPLAQPDTHGILARPGLADVIFKSLERGSRVRVDLSEHWDHWAWLDKPIEVVRAELGID